MKDKKKPGVTTLRLIGIVSIILGVVAIGTPAVAGTAVVFVIGAVLLVAGITQIVTGMKAEGWSHRLPPLILGIITAVAGIGVFGHPILGLQFLTVMLIIFFVVEGLWKIVASFSYRPAKG